MFASRPDTTLPSTSMVKRCLFFLLVPIKVQQIARKRKPQCRWYPISMEYANVGVFFYTLYRQSALHSTAINSHQQPSFTDDTKFHWLAISWLNCPWFLVGSVVNTTNKKCALYCSHQLLQVNKFSNLWLVYLALGNVVSLITQSCQEQLCLWGRFCSQLQTRA